MAQQHYDGKKHKKNAARADLLEQLGKTLDLGELRGERPAPGEQGLLPGESLHPAGSPRCSHCFTRFPFCKKNSPAPECSFSSILSELFPRCLFCLLLKWSFPLVHTHLSWSKLSTARSAVSASPPELVMERCNVCQLRRCPGLNRDKNLFVLRCRHKRGSSFLSPCAHRDLTEAAEEGQV